MKNTKVTKPILLYISDHAESAQNMKLPTYVEATSLPSYEEAERTKGHPDPEVDIYFLNFHCQVL